MDKVLYRIVEVVVAASLVGFIAGVCHLFGLL